MVWKNLHHCSSHYEQTKTDFSKNMIYIIKVQVTVWLDEWYSKLIYTHQIIWILYISNWLQTKKGFKRGCKGCDCGSFEGEKKTVQKYIFRSELMHLLNMYNATFFIIFDYLKTYFIYSFWNYLEIDMIYSFANKYILTIN